MRVEIDSSLFVSNGRCVHLSSGQLYCVAVIERRIYLRRCQVHVFLEIKTHHLVLFSAVSEAAHDLTENFAALQIRIVQHNDAVCNKVFITYVLIRNVQRIGLITFANISHCSESDRNNTHCWRYITIKRIVRLKIFITFESRVVKSWLCVILLLILR